MKKFIYISFIITTIFLSSCQSANENSSQPRPNEQQYIQIQNSNPTEQEQMTNNDIASHLSNIASRIKDVNDSASVVVGPYAVVGIDVDEDLDRQRVGSVKYSVAEALRNDPYGKTAVVIADGDLMERFRRMGEEIKDGRPIKGVVVELAEIVNRYIPDIPVEENQNNNSDPNDNIQKDDEQNLKNIQEEQSNDVQ